MKENLRSLRIANGYTQKEVADALGLESSSTVTMWENGTRKPSVDKLPEIAAFFHCTIDELFKGFANVTV